MQHNTCQSGTVSPLMRAPDEYSFWPLCTLKVPDTSTNIYSCIHTVIHPRLRVLHATVHRSWHYRSIWVPQEVSSGCYWAGGTDVSGSMHAFSPEWQLFLMGKLVMSHDIINTENVDYIMITHDTMIPHMGIGMLVAWLQYMSTQSSTCRWLWSIIPPFVLYILE